MKIYAVRKGKNVGIFYSWDECKEQITGYSGAEFKSFSGIECAKKYLSGEEECSTAPSVGCIAYVDGSYNEASNDFSYGVVIINNGEIVHKISQKATGRNIRPKEKLDAMRSMRNISGEISASVAAIKYCLENKIPSVTIYHDYEGISKWANCEWKAKNIYTQNYRDFVMKARTKCKIQFVKVKGHSNDKYNDMADALAKAALEIQ